MKWYLSLALAGSLFYGCTNKDADGLASEIQRARDQKALQLLEVKVDSLMASSPNEDGGLWYGRLATQSLEISRTLDSERLLFKALRGYPDSRETPANLLELANLYQNYMGMAQAGSAICCTLQSRTEDVPARKSAQCCPTGTSPIDSTLVTLRDSVFNPETGKMDIRMARTYVALGQVRALLFPDDDASADHLNEAAKVAKAIKDPRKAITLYDWILEDYRHTPYGPKAMFLKAFTYENDLGDLESARKSYTEYIEEWPKDDFVDDARFLLMNLGKDPEQIIDEFRKEQVQ